MRFRSTKTYGHEVGLSCAFRQWRANSHCRLIHGYALAVTLTFEADELDANGWVMDFGGLKPIKSWLQRTFDHVTLVAADDPNMTEFHSLAHLGVMQVCIVPRTGCEAFAQMILEYVEHWLNTAGHAPRVRIAQVEVREHGANSAIAIAAEKATDAG